jgi:hypothetical protein
MPKVSPIQSSFNGGEFSPLLHGRIDLDRYKAGLKTCLGYIPTIQGALIRRPGGKYVTPVKNQTLSTRLAAFEFSTTQAYIIEIGNLYFRFYRNNGQIESGGSPYEVVTTYATADLFQLKFAQSADVLYITHPSYPPRKLTRTGHTAWTITTIAFEDGPFLPINDVAANTMTPSATTGSITLTMVNDTFVSTDVDRLVRFKDSANNWTWLKITAFTSAKIVTATVMGPDLATTTATASWRLGAWSTTTGFPAAVTFYEDRLVFIGPTSYPQRTDGSNSSDYENFAPTAADGTISDSNAFSFTLNANKVNAARWIEPGDKSLLSGTVGGEWGIKSPSDANAITPTSVDAKRSTPYGSADVQALSVGDAVLFVQRAGKKIREIQFVAGKEGFQASDLTVLSEHITAPGIVEMAHQQEPQSIVWLVRSDGVLLGMTYERDLDNLVVAWHRHILGGPSDAAGSAAKVESVAVIPSSDGTRSEVWMIVQRYVDGAVKRYVEYFDKFFEDTDDQEDAYFVDSGLTLNSPVTITAATAADPVVVTAASHGFSDGDKVLIKNVVGMTEINNLTFLVANKTANTFELTDLEGNDIDGSAYTAYSSGGEVWKMVSSVSGLDHLEGETVSILADGAVQPNQVVASGAVTLDPVAAVVHVGYGYNSDGQMLILNAGAADGTALGKTQRPHRVGILLHRSLGLKLGLALDSTLKDITFRTAADAMTRAPALFTGIISETLEADYELGSRIAWRQSQPLPSTILAVMPQMHTQDR